jgi:HSP20 family protein
MRSNNSNSNALVRRDPRASSDLWVPSPFGPSNLFDDSFSLLSVSPLQLMRRMQQDMDRLFEQAFGPTRPVFDDTPLLSTSSTSSIRPTSPLANLASLPSLMTPRVDVCETDQDYSIEVELPGVPQDSVDVRVVEGTLLVSAQTRQEWEDRQSGTSDTAGTQSQQQLGQSNPTNPYRQYHYRERRWGRFERQFRLPLDADEDQIRAEFQGGVLNLTLPKKAPQSGERGGRRIAINTSESTALAGAIVAKNSDEADKEVDTATATTGSS